MKLNVIDSIMGGGKTSWAIDKMNNDNKNNYIYITPFLSEVERIKTSVTTKKFYEPKNIGEGKLDSLHKLIVQGKNIASTHALFKMATEETISLLKSNDYILILDEVMEVVAPIPLKKNDLDILFTNELIKVDTDNNNLVVWNEDKLDWETQYDTLRRQCICKNVFMVNKVLLMWTFPVDVFNSFKEVYILTYLFDGQIQRCYYDLYDIDYEYKSVYCNINGKYVLGDYIESYDLTDIKSKINILDDKINTIGDAKTSLSKSWFERPGNNMMIAQLKRNTENYFINKLKSKSNDNMWTVFKSVKNKVKGQRYTKGFVSLGSRATNNYCDKFNLAYLSNIFINPIIKQFFIERGIFVNEDIYALSELLQWIYRSRIRKGESINLYIPSLRMRTLLIDWLNGKIK